MSTPAPLTELPRRQQLLALLSDGAVHSGERLAAQLQVTRAAVWKLIHGLCDLGIRIESQHLGYQLAHAVDLYDAALLQDGSEVHVLFEVDSTNRHVTDHPAREPGRAVLCVAELQQAGRGRRGRQWLAPFGESICLSVGWLFDTLPANFSSLSLVVGVAWVRVLRRHGAHEVGVKWPNDLWWRGQKLAGVLIEMRAEQDGPAHVVIGCGINWHLSEHSLEQLRAQQLSVCDLRTVLDGDLPARNALVRAFSQALQDCLRQFATQGFAPFMAEWQSYDVLRDSPVQVLQGEQRIQGIAGGVTLEGALLVQTPSGLQRFHSGEVSLRPELS